MIIYPESDKLPETRGKLEVFPGEGDHDPGMLISDPYWYWRVKGKNGQKRAQSEGYTRRADAVNAVTDEHSSRIVILDGKILTRDQIQAMIQPWHLVVFNRDGSVYREGLVY